jgi:hypothetical protein
MPKKQTTITAFNKNLISEISVMIEQSRKFAADDAVC